MSLHPKATSNIFHRGYIQSLGFLAPMAFFSFGAWFLLGILSLRWFVRKYRKYAISGITSEAGAVDSPAADERRMVEEVIARALGQPAFFPDSPGHETCVGGLSREQLDALPTHTWLCFCSNFNVYFMSRGLGLRVKRKGYMRKLLPDN